MTIVNHKDPYQTNFVNPAPPVRPANPANVPTRNTQYAKNPSIPAQQQVDAPQQGFDHSRGQTGNYFVGQVDRQDVAARPTIYTQQQQPKGFVESVGQAALDLAKGLFSWPF